MILIDLHWVLRGVSFHKVGLRDIQSSLPDPSEGIFGEDINDASLI
jgi:hypothetical protein